MAKCFSVRGHTPLSQKYPRVLLFSNVVTTKMAIFAEQKFVTSFSYILGGGTGLLILAIPVAVLGYAGFSFYGGQKDTKDPYA